MRTRTALVTVAVAATAASAQLGNLGLSSTCLSAASSLLTGDFATCASFGSLLSLFTSSGSIVDPIDSWLDSVCQQANCSTETLNNASSVIQNGCSSDSSVLVSTVQTVVENWNDVKQGLCLEYSSNSTFCVTDILTKVQNATGSDLSFSTLSNFDASTFSQIPSSAVCSDCSHALVSKFAPIFGANDTSTITGSIADTCGSEFLDGQVPSTVVEASNSSSSNNGSSAVDSTPLNGAGALGMGAAKVAGAAVLAAAGLAVLA
ncbi:hypothetical protein JCM10207_006670 [Rhodosporidiobolus poonsookiae]